MNKNVHMLISQKAEEIEEDVIHMRRHIHMYHELSGEEKETGSDRKWGKEQGRRS